MLSTIRVLATGIRMSGHRLPTDFGEAQNTLTATIGALGGI